MTIPDVWESIQHEILFLHHHKSDHQWDCFVRDPDFLTARVFLHTSAGFLRAYSKVVFFEFKSYFGKRSNHVPEARIPRRAAATSHHATPRHAIPRHAVSCHATPRHVMPRHAMPHRTVPHHAMSRHVMPQHSTACTHRRTIQCGLSYSSRQGCRSGWSTPNSKTENTSHLIVTRTQ